MKKKEFSCFKNNENLTKYAKFFVNLQGKVVFLLFFSFYVTHIIFIFSDHFSRLE